MGQAESDRQSAAGQDSHTRNLPGNSRTGLTGSMNAPSKSASAFVRFFGMPTLGGKLVILNGLLWLLVWALAPDHHPLQWGASGLVYLLEWIISFPLALFCLSQFPYLDRGPNLEGILILSVTTGLNSFLWGYGLAWLWRDNAKRWRKEQAEHRRQHGLCLVCGYNLTGNVSGVCPECGAPIHSPTPEP